VRAPGKAHGKRSPAITPESAPKTVPATTVIEPSREPPCIRQAPRPFVVYLPAGNLHHGHACAQPVMVIAHQQLGLSAHDLTYSSALHQVT
jgi:hypothetical protein